MSGTFKKLILATVFATGAQGALACDYCERRVTLTPDLSECYLSKVDAEIAQMTQSGLPAQLINLASCDGAESATRGGMALPIVPGEKGQKPTLSFVLDAPALRCLAQSLRDESWSPEVVKTFEVRRDCATQ